MEKRITQRSVFKVNLFGQLLTEKGRISEKQLEEALNIQRASGGFLGDILLKLGFIDEETLAITFADQFEACFLPLERYKISKDIFKLVPQRLARRYMFVPLEEVDKVLSIAVAMPLGKEILAEIELALGLRLVCVYAAKNRIEKIINDNY